MRQHDSSIRTATTGRIVWRTVWIGVLSASALLHTSTDVAAQGTQDSESFFHAPSQSSGKWYSKLVPWNKAPKTPKFKTPPPREKIKGNEPSEKVKAEGQLSFARLSERRGQPEQAKTIYLAFLEQHPDNPLPLHRLGVMAAAEGDYKEADKYLSKAHHLDERNPDLLADIGYSMYLRGRTEDAEKFFRRALEVKRDHEAAANNLAMLLAETGRTTESLALFKRVSDEAEAYANQGYILAQTGDLEQAKKYFNHALTIDATLKTAAQGMLQVAEYQQNHGSAPDFIRDSEQSQLAASTPPPSNRLSRDQASDVKPRIKTAQKAPEVVIKDRAVTVPRVTADLKGEKASEVVIKDRDLPMVTTRPRLTDDMRAQSPPPVMIADIEPVLLPGRAQTKLVNLPTHDSPNGRANDASEANDSRDTQAARVASTDTNAASGIVRRTTPRSNKKAAATFSLLAHRRVQPAAKPVKSAFTTHISDTPEQAQTASPPSVLPEVTPITPARVGVRWSVTPVRPAAMKSETQTPRELPTMDMTNRLDNPRTSRGPREIRPITGLQEPPLLIRIDQKLKPAVTKDGKE